MTRSLVNDELTLFSYEILGLVGRGGAGAHDLLRMAQRGRILSWAGESQYYVEPKRLARLEQSEASAQTLPHRRKYLLLVSAFLRRLLDLHLELVDEVERKLAPKARKRSQLHAQKRRKSEV